VLKEVYMRLEIVEENEGPVSILRLLGALDISTVDPLRERIISLLDREVPAFALDLTQVTFVDSSGLGTLLNGKKRTLEKGVAYYLLDCPAPLQQLLDLVGLNRVLDFCSRRELIDRCPPPETPLPASTERKVGARVGRRS
jgi:anti-sigma B factor antagonist